MLPQSQIGPSSECGVVVELTTQAQGDETSSWTSVGMTASQLIQACQYAGSNHVGGWTLGGDGSFLKITIMNRRYLQLTGIISSTSTENGLTALLANDSTITLDTS